ncbi:MAG: sugar ABC transporter ATP-binding protein [Armatimonadota bacterium]
MPEYLLEMNNIAKSFGTVKALKSVNLRIRKGEIHALCGENGAGKSTLMKILDGFYGFDTYQGDILLDGQPVRLNSPASAAQHGIAMIYQEIAIHANLSIAENLYVGRLPSYMGVVSSRKMADDARIVLKDIGLDVDVNQLASKLGASQQQLLMIAKALVQNPRILVLDEPTSALTLTESEKLFDILHLLKERGVTCIYISHKLYEVFKLADRITVLRDGETIKTLEKDEFQASDVIQAMVGREISNLYPKENISPGDEVLRAENIIVPHPSIKGRRLVDGVNISLRRGEILGLAGLVGSGRSEVLGAIYKSVKGASCSLYIDNKKVSIRSPKHALSNGITLLTEDRHKTGLILPFSIAENMTIASLPKISRLSVVSPSMQKSASETMVKDLQIKTQSVYTPVRQMSGGNQQKVVLGKLLLTNPRVLLLDEPTRGIDVGAKAEFYRLMCRLAVQGTAIIMVSSELPELLGMCDRFVVLARGKIVDAFGKEEASESRVMLAATGTGNLTSL